MMPKFTILAVRRMSEVTSPGSTTKTLAAVMVWMSACVAEGLDHGGVVGDGGHDAELDLGVVAGEEGELPFPRDEGLADLAAGFGADGNVLEVGIGRGEAAGGGDELVEMGVDAAGFRNDVVRQRVEVGGLEFGGFAPGEDVGDDRVFAFERGERLLVGLVLAGLGFLRLVGEAEVVEEDFAELFGRGDVERAVGVAVDGFREFVDLLLEFDADGRRAPAGSTEMPSISMRTRTGSSGPSMWVRMFSWPASGAGGGVSRRAGR